ncbi:MAG: hypothetical protein IJ498_09820, partial [Akkermansia sp.]|nr:hypothetical protein [Akkermansia sp.]
MILAAGTPLCAQPSDGGTFSVAGGSFSIGEGGAQVTARVTIDDGGSLFIHNAAGKQVMSVGGGLGDWTKTKNPTTWHGKGSAFLPEGTYSVTGTVTNSPMNDREENLAYFRYEVMTQYTVTEEDDEDEDKEEEPPTCDVCGCGKDSGNNSGNSKENAPGSPDEECTGSVSPSSSGGGNGGASPAALADASGDTTASAAASTFLRYDSVWRWTAQEQDSVLTIRPTSGRRMTFALVAGESVARPTALTRHHAVRVELQNADLSPCTSGSPAFRTLTEASGRRVRFDAQGAVAAVISASGRVTTAAEHAAQ